MPSLQSESHPKDERSLKQLAQEAIDVQNACNLSGVVHAWSRSIKRLRELVDGGTEFYNRHPVNCMFASKVHDLTRMGLSDTEPFGEAYKKCQELAGTTL